MEEINPGNIDKPVRPQFLTVLCVLTFISSGFGILTCFLLLFFGSKIRDLVENSPGMDESAMGNIDLFDNTGYWLVSLLVVLVALFGAIKMFRLKKIGFHLYASANIVALILPLIFGTEFSVFGLVLTAAFIAMYASNLKYMS